MNSNRVMCCMKQMKNFIQTVNHIKQNILLHTFWLNQSHAWHTVTQHATCHMRCVLLWTKAFQRVTLVYFYRAHVDEACSRRTNTHTYAHTHSIQSFCIEKSHMIVVYIYTILILHTVPFGCNGLGRICNQNLKINRHNIWTADSIHMQ